MREIVQEEAEVLRGVAGPVPEAAFTSGEVAALVAEMAAALDKEPDGVALAAPQVGVPWRLFIVRMDRVEPAPVSPEGAEAPAAERPALVDAYVNPEILKTSRRRQRADEGCLSVRGIYGTTSRHERVTLRARHASGAPFTRGAGGLLAQIFEHEVDHLNGILFTDAAEELVELKPEELARIHERRAAEAPQGTHHAA